VIVIVSFFVVVPLALLAFFLGMAALGFDGLAV
jgi:hypothetical protein